MPNRVSISYKETGIDAISLGGRYRLGRVQSVDVSTNIPNTSVREIGSDKLVGRIFDLPEVTVTVRSIDVGPRSTFILAGVDWASAASGTRVEMQQINYVCFAQPVKAASTDDIVRTEYIPGAKLQSFNLNYAVGSDATEEFTFGAVDRRWLKYDVVVASGNVSASGVLTLPSTARVLKDGKYVLSAFASGVGYLTPENVTGSTATTVTFDTSVVPANTKVLVTYHEDKSNQWDYTHEFPNVANGYTPAPDQAVGIRGWGAEVYLVLASGTVTTGTPERIYRAQTCSIQGQFNSQKIEELGSEAAVGYSDDIPEITGTLELLQSDFRIGELLADDTAGDNWLASELGTGEWGLLVKVYRRGVDRTTSEPEKVIHIPRLDITQETANVQVQQTQRITFNFASRDNKMYVYKGNMPAGSTF